MFFKQYFKCQNELLFFNRDISTCLANVTRLDHLLTEYPAFYMCQQTNNVVNKIACFQQTLLHNRVPCWTKNSQVSGI